MNFFKSIVILCFFVAPLSLHTAEAKPKSKDQGFARSLFLQLQTEVEGQYPAKEIALRLSQVKSFEEWQTQPEMGDDFKLYVAAMWFEKGYFTSSLQLMESLMPSSTYQPLQKYYRAMVNLNLGRLTEVEPYLVDLSQSYDDVDMTILKTSFLAAHNRLIEALELINTFLKTHSKNGYAYLQRGYLNMLALSHPMAQKDFKKAARLLPKHEVRKRQQAYFQAGLISLKYFLDSKEASKLIKRGKALNPHSDLVPQVMQAASNL